MENMTFRSRDELREYIDVHKVDGLGTGKDGACFLLDDGTVIKYLYADYFLEYALQFKDIEIPSFVFAKAAAVVDGYAAAVFMEHAKGPVLGKNRPDKQSIVTLGDQLEVLVNDITVASKEGIWIRDFHCKNIIHGSDIFRIIDTLPFCFLPKGNYDLENKREVMFPIYSFLLGEIMENEIVHRNHPFYGNNTNPINRPKEYLMQVKSCIEDISGQEITTLEDANKVLKKDFKG